MNLASTILDTLADKFLDGGSGSDLPLDLKKSVFMQILPYDKTRLDQWIDAIDSSTPTTESQKKKYNELYRIAVKEENMPNKIKNIIYESHKKIYNSQKNAHSIKDIGIIQRARVLHSNLLNLRK